MSAPGPTASRFHSLWAAMAAVLVLIFLFAGIRSYRDWRAIREREAAIEERIDAAENRIKALERRTELVETDAATLETLAREELGLVYPEDVVILLPPDLAASETPPSDP